MERKRGDEEWICYRDFVTIYLNTGTIIPKNLFGKDIDIFSATWYFIYNSTGTTGWTNSGHDASKNKKQYMSKQNLGEDKIYSKVCVGAASTNL